VDRLRAAGLRLTGETPDGTYVEICEIADHPWYLGCQFHPEFKSKPMEPHPLFKGFIGAAYEHRQRRLNAGGRAVERAGVLATGD
jgi:CTP synthase